MKYERELLEQLAAQYVIGTLRGRARQRFERVCATNAFASSALRRWEDHMVGLAAQVKPIVPPAHVRTKIEERLGLKAPAKKSLFGWSQQRWSVAAFASVAAIAIVVGVLITQSSPTTIAVIAQADQGELWRVSARKDNSAIVIEASTRVKLDAAHAYELWALPDSGAAPVSLGVLPNRGVATLALSAAQQAALKGASKIAVSLEPLGGSPTGAPTGPVLHVAELAKLS